MESSDILRPDNHELFDHIRLRLVARDPVVSWEEIAAEFSIEVPELVAWFLTYRMPKAKTISRIPLGPYRPRDAATREELARLRSREASLLTVANEGPVQLGRVQSRIISLERMR
jgi:hypothetical protein